MKIFCFLLLITVAAACNDDEKRKEPVMPDGDPAPVYDSTNAGAHKDTASYERMSWPAPDSSR